jgi:hypothetical protein
LAQQHGGSLTINPHTGLPEAGFLSSILPMAAAAAAIYFTGGAAAGAEGFMGLSAAQTGMLAGAATGALTNQQNPLMGGLMGGLSGYGMAGMMGGLASAGTLAPGTAPAPGDFLESQVATAPTPTVPDVGTAAGISAKNMSQFAPSAGGVGIGGISQFGGNVLNPVFNVPSAIATPAPMTDLATGFAMDALPLATAPVSAPVVAAPAPVVSPPDLSAQYTDSGINTPVTPPSAAPYQSYGDKLMTGLGKAAASPIDFIKANPGATAAVALPLGLAGIQAMSAQPTLPASMARPAVPNQFYNAQYNPGQRNPNFGQPGQPYFLGQGYGSSGFSTAYAAVGGSMQDIQASARPILPPNQMIGGSAPNENQFYPGANIARGGASGAPQAPAATDVVGGYDQKLDQYTGEPVRMADGGYTGSASGDVGSIPLGGPMPSGFLSGIQSLVQQNPSMVRQLGGDAQSSPNDYVYDPETQQFVKKSDLPPVQGMKKGGKTIDTEINTDEPSERDIYENTDDDTIAKLQKILGRSIAEKSMAGGGIASLNEYAAGGRLLQGPGDGMSDSIPAVIKGDKPQRAALAQGEFVLPADVVSHLGNGSTDAGSKRLYAMMDKIRHARTGSKKQGRQINPDQFMPA